MQKCRMHTDEIGNLCPNKNIRRIAIQVPAIPMLIKKLKN